MEKYELQEGEIFVDEYIEDDGTPVTIFKDVNGAVMHGWVIDLDADVYNTIEEAAKRSGVSMQDFVDNAVETRIMALIDEAKTIKALEEISD